MRQGLAYVLISIVIAGLILLIPASVTVKIWLLVIFIGAIFLDALHIIVQMPNYHDERQNFHKLIIERNVSFAAASAVIGAILVQAYLNRGLLGTDQIPFYISLAIVLGTMILEKWSLKYM
jgi:uncharacterized membrane protein